MLSFIGSPWSLALLQKRFGGASVLDVLDALYMLDAMDALDLIAEV